MNGKAKEHRGGQLREKVMQVVFLIAACISILAVALICIYLFANGLPAIAKLGPFVILLGTDWRPNADHYGIFPMIIGSIYVTAGAIIVGVPLGLLAGGALIDGVCEPWMASLPPGSLPALLFGTGKGAGAALLLFSGQPVHALEFLVIVLVVQQVDGNFIAPRILGSATGISGLWVLAAIVVGGGLFGIPGMVIGVPVLGVAANLAKAALPGEPDGEKTKPGGET